MAARGARGRGHGAAGGGRRRRARSPPRARSGSYPSPPIILLRRLPSQFSEPGAVDPRQEAGSAARMHPWHDIPLGDGADELVPAFIEIPKGSKIKYELDKETGLLRVDRILFSAVHYPANYGFIPRTYCGDGDPLDILVLCQEAVEPMCIMRARPIGFLQMRDDKGIDDKIIAVHADDPAYQDY